MNSKGEPMFYFWLLYRRLPVTSRIVVLAMFLIVFIATVVRVIDATHFFQARQNNVHTRSTSR